MLSALRVKISRLTARSSRLLHYLHRMNRPCVLILWFAVATTAAAQAPTSSTGDEAQVREVIARLFLGMQKGDSALVHSTFARQVTMATVLRDKSDTPVLQRESSIAGFLKAVGTPHTEVWNEEIWDLKIQLDGDFAQAWCGYAFYITNTFSHCGVDAFQLHKTKDGWKIFHLADTRRKSGCVIPANVQMKHK
jgi:hypothetical protein